MFSYVLFWLIFFVQIFVVPTCIESRQKILIAFQHLHSTIMFLQTVDHSFWTYRERRFLYFIKIVFLNHRNFVVTFNAFPGVYQFSPLKFRHTPLHYVTHMNCMEKTNTHGIQIPINTFALRIRPSRWASWRLDPACEEICIITLASGISMELSPTCE